MKQRLASMESLCLCGQFEQTEALAPAMSSWKGLLRYAVRSNCGPRDICAVVEGLITRSDYPGLNGAGKRCREFRTALDNHFSGPNLAKNRWHASLAQHRDGHTVDAGVASADCLGNVLLHELSEPLAAWRLVAIAGVERTRASIVVGVEP